MVDGVEEGVLEMKWEALGGNFMLGKVAGGMKSWRG